VQASTISTTSSLGCITLPRNQWKSFKELGYAKLKEYKQSTFSFILIDEEERRK
jgi:lysozyme